MNALLPVTTIILYVTSGLLIGLRLFGAEHQWKPPRYAGLLAGWLALALHALMLYSTVIRDTGLNLAFFPTLSLLAWVVVLLLMASSITKPVENLGIVLMPVSAILLVLSWRGATTHILPQDAGLPLAIHVLLSLLAYGLLTLASGQAVLLAVQDRKLHKHHPGGFVRALPPLQSMETLLFQLIAVGFILLTAALASGFFFVDNLFAQHLVHKTVLSIIAWMVFAGLLWGRYRYGWRGRKALRWTLIGFSVLMLAYLGSKAVLELILQRT